MKQHVNKVALKKYATCTVDFFIPFTCVTINQFYSTTSPVLFTQKVINYGMRKYICVYVGALVYHIISNEADDRIFRCNRIFGYPFMYKQLILIK